MSSVKVNLVSSLGANGSTHDSMTTDGCSILLLNTGLIVRDEIGNAQLLVLGILDAKVGLDWTLVLNSQCELLLSVYFGQAKVNHWLHKGHNRPSEIGLT